MLYLKAVNLSDADAEYAALSAIPAEENGFTNPYAGIAREDFMNRVLPDKIAHSRGERVPDGHVPDTDYYLWNGDTIVGLFHVRHCLNDFLRQGPGHIGYCILKPWRGRGFAKAGLKLALDVARQIVPEDEIYMSVNKDNPASLRVQLANGAYIHHESASEYFTRIPISGDHACQNSGKT